MILRYVHITEIHNICFLKKFKDFTAFIFTYVSHIFKVQEKNCYSQKRKLHIFKPTKCNDYFSFVIRLLQFSRLISVIFYLIYFQDCLLAYYIFLVFFSRRKKSWLMFFLIWLYFGVKLPKPNLYYFPWTDYKTGVLSRREYLVELGYFSYLDDTHD